jgi:hypothetical protein
VGNLENPTGNLPTIKEENKPRKRTSEQKAKARARALELKAERATKNAAKAARDTDAGETDVEVVEDQHAKKYTTTKSMRSTAKKSPSGDGDGV